MQPEMAEMRFSPETVLHEGILVNSPHDDLRPETQLIINISVEEIRFSKKKCVKNLIG